jgi:CBS domain-containing protein
MKIHELLKMKGREVVTVHPTATLETAIRRMKLGGTGYAIVSEDGKQVDGIIAVRDFAYTLADHHRDIEPDTPVAKIMTRTVKTCSPEDTLKSVMEQMTRAKVLNFPVLEDGVLCGIVSIDDVVKYAVQEMELESEVLRDDLIRLQTLKSLR